jgi:hypothetical protein
MVLVTSTQRQQVRPTSRLTGADSVKDSDTVMAQRILRLIDRNCRQGLAIEMLTGALVAVPPPFSITTLSIR